MNGRRRVATPVPVRRPATATAPAAEARSPWHAPSGDALVPATDRPALRAGLAALWHEDLATAEAHLREAIDADPEDATAYALLGATLLAGGRAEGAMLAIEHALTLDPAGFLPQMKAGELALRLGDPGLAADRFLAALRASEPGSREAMAASAARTAAQRALSRAIEHRAVLPGWMARLIGERRVRFTRRRDSRSMAGSGHAVSAKSIVDSRTVADPR